MFLGSDAYPESDAIDKYLQRFGGSSNACSEAEDCCFFAQAHVEGFGGAVARMAAALAAPLLTHAAMEREVRPPPRGAAGGVRARRRRCSVRQARRRACRCMPSTLSSPARRRRVRAACSR